MYYYHMTSLDNLQSISEKGLIPKNEANSKLIGDEKFKVYFSEGFEGAVALFVDFQMVYDQIKEGQMKVTDECVKTKVLKSESLSDYLGEGVYLRFDGTGIENERNFENGCTDKIIAPEKLMVCILWRKSDDSVIFSRFEMIKYMMAEIQPEQIQYYGANYDRTINFAEATKNIQGKVKKYYEGHRMEISEYENSEYILDFIGINDFINKFL